MQNYSLVQNLATQFKEENGSLICSELLGLASPKSSPKGKDFTNPTPAPRTEEYYQKRPCADLVYDAAEILERYIREERESECN